MAKHIDLTGQKFGKLTVINYFYTKKPNYIVYYKCKCDCGNITVISSGHLKSGHTKSCGCLKIEKIKIKNTGNVWGRKYSNPIDASAKSVWQNTYSDGCSFEKFLELSQMPCHYCGILPFNIFNKYITKDGKLTNQQVSNNWAEKTYFKYNGLDRIDSSKNHDESNVVSCCFICNRAKNNMTTEEFKIWLNRICNNYLK